jgi:hypothetical protein
MWLNFLPDEEHMSVLSVHEQMRDKVCKICKTVRLYTGGKKISDYAVIVGKQRTAMISARIATDLENP